MGQIGDIEKNKILPEIRSRPSTLFVVFFVTIQNLCYEVLQHLPYSPDIFPSGYHIFGHIITSAMHSWLAAQRENKLIKGIGELHGRWQNCIFKQGNHIKDRVYMSSLNVD